MHSLGNRGGENILHAEQYCILAGVPSLTCGAVLHPALFLRLDDPLLVVVANIATNVHSAHNDGFLVIWVAFPVEPDK